jgi:hypothetical protein
MTTAAVSTSAFAESVLILALFLVGAAALVYASVVAVMKGKTRMVIVAWLASVLMILPTMILLAVAAIRLAKPTSRWAKRYDERKMAESARRFAKPVIVVASTTSGIGH